MAARDALYAPPTMPIFLDECSLCNCSRPASVIWPWLEWALEAQARPPEDAHERSYALLQRLPPCCRSTLAMDGDGLELLARLLRRRTARERAAPYDEALPYGDVAPLPPRYLLAPPDPPAFERAVFSVDHLLDQWQDGLLAASRSGPLAAAPVLDGRFEASLALTHAGRRRRDGLVPLFGRVEVALDGAPPARLEAVFLGLLPCPAPGEYVPVEGCARFPRLKETAPRNVLLVTTSSGARGRTARAALRSCASLYGASLLLALEATEPPATSLEAAAEDLPLLRARVGACKDWLPLRELLRRAGALSAGAFAADVLGFMHGVLERPSAVEREILARRARRTLERAGVHGGAEPAGEDEALRLPHCEGDAGAHRLSLAFCLARLLGVYFEVDLPDDESLG